MKECCSSCNRVKTPNWESLVLSCCYSVCEVCEVPQMGCGHKVFSSRIGWACVPTLVIIVSHTHSAVIKGFLAHSQTSPVILHHSLLSSDLRTELALLIEHLSEHLVVIMEDMEHFFNACITPISGSVQEFSFLPVLYS